MNYRNFTTALYLSIRDITIIPEFSEFEKAFSFIEKHIRVGKVYLETYRVGIQVDEKRVRSVKEFFEKRGIRTSGGITPNIKGEALWDFKSCCYTDPDHLEVLRKVVVFTAGIFDEIILDDFYFNNCTCKRCVVARGNKSWPKFRTDLMREVTEKVFMGPAKKVNPKVKMIIKYPNWYEDYHGTGYNLKDDPDQFDFIYTGTETRNPLYTQQSLPRYISYFIMRYLSNTAPDRNNGGWFDTFDSSYNPNSYIEQGLLTLFAKPKEVTLFCMGLLLFKDRIFTPLAGFVFDRVDAFLGKLGNPQGIACYKPFHSRGEDYLHGYLGMLGIPLEPTPFPPADQEVVLLAESAKADPKITDFIKSTLQKGKTVVVTSGLVKALAARGIREITEIEVLDKKYAVREFACQTFHCAFKDYSFSRDEVLMPEVSFYTNDVKQIVVAFTENRNIPVLLECRYTSGRLFVLTIPDDAGDLYKFPREVLDTIREKIMTNLPVRINAPSGIGLFLYDNGTFIVESFLSYNQTIEIVIGKRGVTLTDCETGEKIGGRDEEDRTIVPLHLLPAGVRVFSWS